MVQLLDEAVDVGASVSDRRSPTDQTMEISAFEFQEREANS